MPGRIIVVDGANTCWGLLTDLQLGCELELWTDLQQLPPRCDALIVGGATPLGLKLLAQAKVADPDGFGILGGADPEAALEALGSGGVDAVLLPMHPPATWRRLILDGCAGVQARRRARAQLAQLAIDKDQAQDLARRLQEVVDERTTELDHAQQLVRQQHVEMVRLETQALVSQIARGLAHELNNPLAAILGYAQRLRRSFAKEPEAVRRLDVILGEVDRCHSLVEQLRNLATPLAETPMSCQASQLLGEAVARRHEAQLPTPTHHVPEDIPEILAAPQSLLRVFDQLLDNAILAGATHCELRGALSSDRVRLVLSNDGLTPDENTTRNATRPFFTTMADAGHRGLGLASAHAILRDQHGTLELAIREDGPGAACIMTLPAAPQDLPPAEPLPERSGEIVLIVDDEPLVAELLLSAIDEDGLKGRVVGTLAEALQEIRSGGLRALITDVRLPDGNGVDLLRQALSLRPELQGHIALVTGSSQGREELGLAAHDLTPLLTKPFRMEQIARLVRAIT
jgi:signal transduction histidine kinase/CheY-like chemotaxis protein